MASTSSPASNTSTNHSGENKVSQKTQPVAPQNQSPFIPTSERRLVDHNKTDVTHYNYKGGQTAVMTGGVMLGLGPTTTKSAPPTPAPTRNGQNEGGAKTALARGKGSYNAGGNTPASATTSRDTPGWTSGNPLHYTLDNEPKSDVFERCYGAASDFDKKFVEKCERDIDALLVFAGLFSAVVTTFVVDTYHDLSPDSQDQIVNLLEKLVANSQQSPATPDLETFTPEQTSIRVNIFFFLSLITSLSGALLAILCKQWLQEYIRDYPPHVGDKQRLATRQSRYLGLHEWRVPGLVAFIPLFLEVATVLFFVGLVDLLWSIHHTVAIIMMVPIIISLLFVVVTALLPPIFLLAVWLTVKGREIASRMGQCPYKTPLGWTIIRVLTTRKLPFIRRMLPARPKAGSVGTRTSTDDTVKDGIAFTRMLNWTTYDIKFGNGDLRNEMLAKAITWIYPFIPSGDYAKCLGELEADTAYTAFHHLRPFLKVVRGISPPKRELPLDTLDRFFEYAKKENLLPDEVRKDIIVISSVLYRRNAPNKNKINHCLERCVRITNSLSSGKAEGIPEPEDICREITELIVYLVNACGTYRLNNDLFHQVDKIKETLGGETESNPIKVALEPQRQFPSDHLPYAVPRTDSSAAW
ncbi:hypothetical protein V5O48_003930 [Marasmius crinis-equi]|uniref:DUF6535 domain-containing protein n=1 Tax=Marasmius crinis-equi TaxID=585013 RepID=A0ABR3FRJ4_9AGAR